jgi:hypothetical protein
MKPGRVFPGVGFGNGRMPVATVKKTPLKRLFSPQTGRKKQVFPCPETVSGKGAFNIYR